MKTLVSIIVLGLLPLTGCKLVTVVKYERSPLTGWAYNNPSLGGFEKNTTRKVVYSANITTEVKNCDTVAYQLVALAKKYQGFVLQSGTTYSTIRVASTHFKEAITEIEKLGKITSKNISGGDVTDEYNDYNMRLENAESARKRYLQLLEKSVSVEEILKVEKELERLNLEIENLKGKTTQINHDVDFSSITIHYNEKQKLGLLGYVFVGTYKGIKWLFVRG